MTHTNDDAWQQATGGSGLLDWQLDPYGVQMYPAVDGARQWVQQSCRCPRCDHTWQAVAPLDSAGIECPKCYEVDLSFVWKER